MRKFNTLLAILALAATVAVAAPLGGTTGGAGDGGGRTLVVPDLSNIKPSKQAQSLMVVPSIPTREPGQGYMAQPKYEVIPVVGNPSEPHYLYAKQRRWEVIPPVLYDNLVRCMNAGRVVTSTSSDPHYDCVPR